jgi:hypothetical protein
MKFFTLFISLFVISTQIIAQWEESNYDINFENDFGPSTLNIDTISNPNNIWQIGHPQKTLFTDAFSAPNAIVTDTLNTYPINDTSVFVITNVAVGMGFEWPHTVSISAKYFVDSDTLTDYGNFEFSPDNGITWVNLLDDTGAYASSIYWNGNTTTFTGNSNGWETFKVNIQALGPVFDITYGDTVLYRFTFVSDSIETHRDGLMFDNFRFLDYVEDLDEYQNDNFISIFPNPAKNELFIEIEKVSFNKAIQITNYQGQLIYDNTNFVGNSINIENFENGVYFLRYSDDKGYSIKRFVVKN